MKILLQTRILVLHCSVILANEEKPWRLTSSIALQLQESAVHVLESNADAVAKLSRASTCAAAIIGAPWDGHFRAFIGRGKLQELAEILKQDDVDVMLLLYKGYSDGAGEDDFLPKELWAGLTRSSYEIRVFHGGIDRGRVDIRNLAVQELANEIRAVCNDASTWEL